MKITAIQTTTTLTIAVSNQENIKASNVGNIGWILTYQPSGKQEYYNNQQFEMFLMSLPQEEGK